MQKPLQIYFHNIQHSPAIEERIKKECEKLEHFYNNIIGCTVTVDSPHRQHHQGNLYDIKVRLTLPDGELFSTRPQHDNHAHEDAYVAIRDSFNAVRRQLEDYARKRRQDVKQHPSRLL